MKTIKEAREQGWDSLVEILKQGLIPTKRTSTLLVKGKTLYRLCGCTRGIDVSDIENTHFYASAATIRNANVYEGVPVLPMFKIGDLLL